ncbi:MAG: hypothetical protein ACRCTJ_03805, partial [Brevinema sp.]
MLMPRRLLDTSLRTKIILFVIFTTFFSLIFISLSIIKGLEISSRMDIAKNNTSHINIRTQNYNPNNPYDQSTWWQERRSSLEDRISDEYVRGITTRTTLPGIIIDSNHPIFITVIEDRDITVFNKKIFPSENNRKIPFNSIYIGKQLAKKLKLGTRNVVDISIPTLKTKLSSVRISHVMPEINPFIDHHGVFIDKDSLENLEEKFRDYHVRFRGSPYQALLISNFSIFLYPNNFDTPNSKLEYQFTILNKLTDSIIQWGSWIYLLLTLILFSVHYFHYYYLYDDIKEFAYRQGYLKIQNLYLWLLFKTIFFIFITSLSGITIAYFVCSLKLKIFAN